MSGLELFANASPPTTPLLTALSAAISSPITVPTAVTVSSSSGFPTAATSGGQFRCLIDSEIYVVTNVSGTTWTVVGGQEGTTATTHANGATVAYSQTAGALVNLANANTPGQPQPSDHSFFSWAFDPTPLGSTSGTPTAGTIYLTRLAVPRDKLITKITIYMIAGGTSIANCFVGLYDSLGNLLVSSSDQSANWSPAGSGFGQKDVTVSQALTGGPGAFVYVALLEGTVTTTAAKPFKSAQTVGSPLLNIGQNSTTGYRGATGGTGMSALPSTITITPAADAYWAAIS